MTRIEHAKRSAKWAAENPDKVKAAHAIFYAKRKERVHTQGASVLPRWPIISSELLARFQAAGALYVFQSREHTLSWVADLPSNLREEIIAAGVGALLPQYRRILRGVVNIGKAIASNRARVAKNHAANRAFANVGRTALSLLDSQKIGDRALGDCTRADLLREAHRLETEANEMTLDAAVYRGFAGLLHGNQTLRQLEGAALERRKTLLLSRWGDEESA